MSFDGDSHSFVPTGNRAFTPEAPYVGLASILSTAYGFSQESARVLLTKPWPYVDRRVNDAWFYDHLVEGTWTSLYDETGILIPRPTDRVLAILAFRPGTGSTVGLRVTVGSSTSVAAEYIYESTEYADPMDRDATEQLVIAAHVDTTALDLSSSVRLFVEASATTPILPEWLMVVRGTR